MNIHTVLHEHSCHVSWTFMEHFTDAHGKFHGMHVMTATFITYFTQNKLEKTRMQNSKKKQPPTIKLSHSLLVVEILQHISWLLLTYLNGRSCRICTKLLHGHSWTFHGQTCMRLDPMAPGCWGMSFENLVGNIRGSKHYTAHLMEDKEFWRPECV